MENPVAKRKGEFADGGTRKNPKLGGASSSGPKMSFAAKMMAKMGYKEGEGLGKAGEGILNPIEVKLRPQGVGVGVVREKTEQAKAEAKREATRRGEEFEDSSEEERNARRKRKQAGRSATDSGTSTPGGRARPKVRYRTAADIEAAADGLQVPNVLKSLIDATGRERKMLTSTAGLMTVGNFASTETETQKLAKTARMELESFADAWNDVSGRKEFAEFEESRLQREVDRHLEEIRKSKAIMDAVVALSCMDLGKPNTAEKASDQWEEVVSQLETLQVEFRDELDAYDLSEAAVGAIHPLFKQEMLDWDIFERPTHLVPELHRLRGILGIEHREKTQNGHDDFEARKSKSTTPYESMIYSLWLPKVRTAVTNDWDPHSPSSLIVAVEAWRDLLPEFIYHGLVNNLIVQKLSSAINDWNPRLVAKNKKPKQPPPHTWLFPWLPYLSEQHTDPKNPTGLLADVKRKFRVALDTCDLSRGPIPGLEIWREALLSELDHALVRHLLPRLAALLNDEFEVDPSDQDLTPLEQALAWNSFFKPSTMGQLLIAEFFPKWLNVLHLWLTSEPNYEEVAQWFSWWKEQIPGTVSAVPAVAEMWEKGLEMMNQALDLGENVREELPLPSAGPARPVQVPQAPAAKEGSAASRRDVEEEATFKDVVEAWCSDENLLLIPLREAHESTGLPLFRMTASATGKGGVLLYLKGDVIWAQNKKERSLWEPIGLEDVLVQRAEGK